jgi:hypothetical protein
MLFSVSLAKKLGNRGLVSVSLHPGVIIDTGLVKHMQMEEFAELGMIQTLDTTSKLMLKQR